MTEIITLLSCIAPIIEKKRQKQLSIIIKAMLTMNGRITMLAQVRHIFLKKYYFVGFYQ